MESPPFTITTTILDLVVQIAERVGSLGLKDDTNSAPKLRRENRIKSIHASLAIENNTLSLDQVTALLDGKHVLGPAREIQEVKNAFSAYEKLNDWKSYKPKHLLQAHALMMENLVDHPGSYRTGGVGISKGDQVVHVAPPASMVPGLVKDLLNWLKSTNVHPLISSCVLHYELEFIHPFADGNGRIGRMWQTLILSKWRPPLAYLPIEDLIRKNQQNYYNVLAACDKVADSSQFIEFILQTLLETLDLTHQIDSVGDPVSDPVSDPVKSLLNILKISPLSTSKCMQKLGLSHRPTFRKNYLNPALAQNLIERTIPDKPNSRLQKYRLLH